MLAAQKTLTKMGDMEARLIKSIARPGNLWRLLPTVDTVVGGLDYCSQDWQMSKAIVNNFSWSRQSTVLGRLMISIHGG